MTAYLLGIDAGSTAYKAAVIDLSGREVGVAARTLAHSMPRPGWVERPLVPAWSAMCEVIREALDRAGVDGARISAVGSTGHGNGLYALDARGEPVRDAIASLDTRAHAVVDAWRSDATVSNIRARTNQALWPGQPNALLAWLRDNEPETFRAIRSVLMVTDYVNYRLAGVRTSSVSMMSGTSLMDVFSGSFDPSLLELYGLGEVLPALPPLHDSHDVIGHVTAEAARETGLAAGTPVVSGAYDIDASAIGSGVVTVGQACVIAGTWSINEVVSAEPNRDPSLLMSKHFAVPGLWLDIDASAASTANLDWFVAQFLGEERRAAEARGQTVFDRCDELVAGADDEVATVIFHPFLFGSDVKAAARAGFYGIGGWHAKAHLLRAVYEGVAFGHRVHVDRLRAAGARIPALRFTGGGSRSPVWAQMFADVLDATVEVPAGGEVGALGAAMIAAVGVGLFPDLPAAARAMVSVQAMHVPDPRSRDRYAARFAIYRDLLGAMDGSWDRLALLDAGRPA